MVRRRLAPQADREFRRHAAARDVLDAQMGAAELEAVAETRVAGVPRPRHRVARATGERLQAGIGPQPRQPLRSPVVVRQREQCPLLATEQVRPADRRRLGPRLGPRQQGQRQEQRQQSPYGRAVREQHRLDIGPHRDGFSHPVETPTSARQPKAASPAPEGCGDPAAGVPTIMSCDAIAFPRTCRARLPRLPRLAAGASGAACRSARRADWPTGTATAAPTRAAAGPGCCRRHRDEPPPAAVRPASARAAVGRPGPRAACCSPSTRQPPSPPGRAAMRPTRRRCGSGPIWSCPASTSWGPPGLGASAA